MFVDAFDGHVSETSGQPRQQVVRADAGGGGADTRLGLTAERDDSPLHPRLLAMIMAGRYHGMELDPGEYRAKAGETAPSAGSLSAWAQSAGMWSRAVRLRWRHLLRFHDSSPIVLLFTDGSAGLLTGANSDQGVVFIQDPTKPESEPSVPVDELRLARVWHGECVLLRANRGIAEADAPFNLPWLIRLVLGERRSLRDIGLASFILTFLKLAPILIIMRASDRILIYKSFSTLTLVAILLALAIIYEALLNHARQLLIVMVSTRLDARLTLHVFNRLLRLPLDYFERHPSGETMHKIGEIYKIREFLTGSVLTSMLDCTSLIVLLPIMFYLFPALTWIVMACACLITLIIIAFLPALRVLHGKLMEAEVRRAAVLSETVFGIKTVKAIALEPQRKAVWDERVADAGKWHLAFGRLAAWPQTLVVPVQSFMTYGVFMIGVYMAITDSASITAAGMFGFMLLSRQVANPLVSLAKLVEEYERANAAVSHVASVVNRPPETNGASGGLRPQFSGAISFENVTFTYGGTKTPALDKVAFAVPAGTMLGIVGRSGSGKSTVTRLLQGINRDYTGYLKIDGTDLREINLRYLRSSFGVVLQDNFLFRGSIRECILADRPGLTLEDAVRAARLAGAEEFIERMPSGYETFIQEGSPNLSGGQKQRLAIARALITDPRILILDEATSALDPESEALVNANLLRIARGRTMVIVSHRLSSLTECDQILVLEKGHVEDIAPHQVLLERCTIYRQLWAQQNRHLNSEGSRHAAAAPTLIQGN
jgi:subfamily B ATP-binding cassette protein HlyB/CyaB